MVWQYLGQGKYNRVYVDRKKGLVLKRAINSNLSYDQPERSVRLWNIINPNLEPAASLHRDGWTCPYIEGRQATDHETHLHLIETYQNTGRIVLDACSPENMIYSLLYKRVFCIDIGLAVMIESLTPEHRRRYSEVSNAIWGSLSGKFVRYFEREQKKFPLTVTTIKALFVLSQYLPQESPRCLQYPEILNRIAQYFDTPSLTPIEVQALANIIPINFHQLKRNIEQEILTLLRKYGQFDGRGGFHRSLYGLFFSNQRTMQSMVALIQSLRIAEDTHQLETIITTCLNTIHFTRACCFKNPLQACLLKFLRVLEDRPPIERHLAPTH